MNCNNKRNCRASGCCICEFFDCIFNCLCPSRPRPCQCDKPYYDNCDKTYPCQKSCGRPCDRPCKKPCDRHNERGCGHCGNSFANSRATTYDFGAYYVGRETDYGFDYQNNYSDCNDWQY